MITVFVLHTQAKSMFGFFQTDNQFRVVLQM